MNNGLEEFVKETRRSPSIRVNCFSNRSLAVNLAPEGNPDANPIAHTNPPTPGTRKKGRINGSRITPKKLTTPKLINNSEIIKNGSRKEIQFATTYVSRFLMLQRILGKDD